MSTIDLETRNIKLKLAMTPIDQDPMSFVKRYSSVFANANSLDKKQQPPAA